MNDPLDTDAELRHRLHRGQRSHRPLSKDYERVGLAGEQAFCDMFGIPVDRSLRPQGTNGINYTINGVTVNVYTARKAYHLLVEAKPRTTRADVYVLAEYNDRNRSARLVGWATREEVVSRPPTADIGKHGVESHAIHNRALRPMVELYTHVYDMQSEPDLIGLAGELAFLIRVLGDRTFIPQRDRRRPIPVSPWTVRVVTDRDPTALRIRLGNVLPRVAVLAGIDEGSHPRDVYWCGWTTGEEIVGTPADDGTDTITIPRDRLRPMSDLYQIIGARGPDAIEAATAEDAREPDGDGDSPGVQPSLFSQ